MRVIKPPTWPPVCYSISSSAARSPLQFTDVHLLSLIVEFALITNVLHGGAQLGLILEDSRITRGEETVIVVTTMLRVCAFPLIYGGLLAIAVALDNVCSSARTRETPINKV